MVDILIKNGTKVNVEDEIGRTPLHMAATRGQTEIAKFLIKKNAHIDARTKDDGSTALFIAAEGGN